MLNLVEHWECYKILSKIQNPRYRDLEVLEEVRPWINEFSHSFITQPAIVTSQYTDKPTLPFAFIHHHFSTSGARVPSNILIWRTASTITPDINAGSLNSPIITFFKTKVLSGPGLSCDIWKRCCRILDGSRELSCVRPWSLCVGWGPLGWSNFKLGLLKSWRRCLVHQLIHLIL